MAKFIKPLSCFLYDILLCSFQQLKSIKKLLKLKIIFKNNSKSANLKTLVRVLVGSIGGILNIIEVSSYGIYFYHIAKHDNTVAVRILDPSVITKRNKRNAISMMGQLVGWIMEVWHVVLIGILTPIFNLDSLRNVSSLLKNFEFCLIPLVQIWTSVPIKRYLLKSHDA